VPNNTQGAHAPGTLDTAALRRKLTGRIWWTCLRNGGIYAIMAFGSPALTGVVRDSSLPWLVYIVAPFTGVGIIGLIVTLKSIPVAIIITRSCRKTLAQYSFDAFWPQITKVDAAEATKGRPKKMTITLCTAEGQASPLMRMDPVPASVAWRNPWPEGIESGVYIAGDLPFGAVGYVPSSGAFFLMQPEDWDATAQDRKLVAPDRVTRAQDAGLTRRII
jgi:hypothetical protein